MQNPPVVLVTGASAGIGKAIAAQLCKEGYLVYGAARRVEKMKDLVPLGLLPLKMDITQEADIARVMAQIEQDHGGVDVLVNNAGYGSFGAMEDTSLEEARRQFEVNLFGLAWLTQRVLPRMRQQGRGKIINISSMAGKIYTPLGSWYHATKHALEGWSDCLRIEVAPFGIDVVIVEPGLIGTEFDAVVMEPMLERSGDSAYAPMARKLEQSWQDAYQKNAPSPPSIIANVVVRAIAAKRPKTRYAAGQFAKLLMTLRAVLSDRLFDVLVTRAM